MMYVGKAKRLCLQLSTKKLPKYIFSTREICVIFLYLFVYCLPLLGSLVDFKILIKSVNVCFILFSRQNFCCNQRKSWKTKFLEYV